MKRSFAYPYGVWMAVFIIAPILLVVLYAFRSADGGFTLSNFSCLPGCLPIFARSFWLALLSTVMCLVLGYPMAYLMSRLSASKQSLCMMLIMLPMWINFLLRTYAWMSILENNGFINGFFRSIGLISFLQTHFGYTLDYIPLINTQGAIVLGMVYNFLPFMVLPIYTVLIKLDRKLIEAAQDLGAPTHLVFRRVIFPLSIPGVISGITMVFVPSVSTFVISQMLGSGKNLLVGDLIDADDGGGCFYTDAQPIDYTQGMDYSPQQLAADSGLGDTVPLACESNASYSLAHHPDIKFTATGSPDGRKALEVSAPGSARHALITAKPGTFDVSLHDERGIVSGESFPYEANDSWTYRLSGQALRGALDLAVGWADPQETSLETAGLGLALDDGMETTHGR